MEETDGEENIQAKPNNIGPRVKDEKKEIPR